MLIIYNELRPLSSISLPFTRLSRTIRYFRDKASKSPFLLRIKDDKVLTLEPHLAVFDAYKSIDNSEMKHKFAYKSANEAFDAAVTALKGLLNEVGYKEENGVFVK